MNGQLFLDYMDIVLRSEKVQTGPAKLSDVVKNDYEAWELGEIAACEFAKQTSLLRKSTTITSVASTGEYDCPPDFIKIAKKAPDKRTDVLLYTLSGETEGELIWREPVNDSWGNDTTETESTPGSFDIIEQSLAPAEVTGTTTAAGAVANGEAVLTAAAGAFTTTGSGLVYPRYRVRNTTSGKPHAGIVLAVTSATALKTAMFNKGAAQSWASGDTYAIQSVSKFRVKFPYLIESAGNTITLDYHCFPPPVYSPIGMWGFPDQSHVMAIAIYAVWFLKFRNVQQQQAGDVNVASLTSDRLYLMWQEYVNTALADKRKRMTTYTHSPLMGVM